MKELIPWWARIGAKLVLSRLPATYGVWRKLNLFTHGAMDQADYAVYVFQKHFARAQHFGERQFVALELGPGDSLSSAIIAAAHGATHTHLVDVGHFATHDLAVYRELASHLQVKGMRPPDLKCIRDIVELLKVCRATYHTHGLESMRSIPAQSVDFIWSHAVLEHLRRHEFADLVREMRRVLRSPGICSHQVDLQDHLGGALNHMRISSRWWETDWMAQSGFYTNRLTMSEMLGTFERAGFVVEVIATERWDRLPTPRAALAPEFQTRDTQELLVKGFEVLLSPV
jgi:predicted SAM-dependent methyltransferase